MSKKHELKTDPAVFQDVYSGEKTWEIRRDDRNFCVDDCLLLLETQHTGQEMQDGKPLVYTGRAVLAHVTYVFSGPAYGLAAGWCIMSIKMVGSRS
ncbi:hypothetical protein DFW101_3571 [Solidesulfovibrio carbinoliphilus subsp. oakridgensis]|uniref:DUF3850 domain-containing protein n=1 Tax=Solidesulfovibrio carbinoliphilus subsp. oakridgensis TaxID=694327 RepID=G7Q5K8_9BACT|nr:DUF3850 domain-containing protein [Solidesulfovibrio carbinoliphilus]EHJ49567.1 hypothetical protein DFW101_3571 [Solidesulfovibrio carbinoliphilus subsp. oakridgensis]